MFEGTRLSYIVPGYTGHIPHIQRDDPIPIQKQDPKYQIPGKSISILSFHHILSSLGYDGYIHSIKSENLYGKPYGKITYSISQGEQLVGQDVPAQTRYTSVTQDIFVNQRQVLQRTAAEIVGVPPGKFTYPITDKMRDSKFWDEQVKHTQLLQAQDNQVPQNFNQSAQQFYGGEKAETIKIGVPLPGYTGTNKRVVAANIFGQTFANARKTAIQDQQNIEAEKI